MTLVRHATSADASLIAALTRAAWAGTVPADSSAHEESEERVLSDLRSGGGLLLEHAGQQVGSVRWHALDSVWEVCRLGVLPQRRGEGHALRLMREVEALAATAGVREVHLAVRHDASLKLVQFYQHLGYVIDPLLVYTHANPRNPSPIVMKKDLLSGRVPGVQRTKEIRS